MMFNLTVSKIANGYILIVPGGPSAHGGAQFGYQGGNVAAGGRIVYCETRAAVITALSDFVLNASFDPPAHDDVPSRMDEEKERAWRAAQAQCTGADVASSPLSRAVGRI